MTPSPSTTKRIKTKRASFDTNGEGSKVVLYNCNCHTFDSVIVQLLYAIECSFEQAKRYAYVIHLNGKATVYKGTQEKCDDVADKLAEIGLIVRVTS
ncbi:TPA: Clp protease ClpS [Patescibacteria group bacterium]|nr:MAG: ATP-dependent Clp protease adaptor protein ClpS [Parcubacteria group bacterium GW2011_GWD2_42_14]HCC05438.1 Clp protease ClpS [Patescibacteria group bacterium]